MKNFLTLILGLFLMTGNLFGAKQIDDVNLTEVFANKFYNLSDKGKVVRLNKESIKKIWEQQIKLEDGLTVELVDFVGGLFE